MSDAGARFRTVVCSKDTPHGFPLLVQGDRGQIHVPLTVFARRAQQQLSAGSARAYLSALLPFVSEVECAPPSEEGCGWEAAPHVVRRVVANYLNDRYACLIRPHRVGFQLVARTAATRSGVGLFLAALKFFYRVLREEGIYAHENPLVDQVSMALATIELMATDDSRRAPRMPERSGVVEPRSRARLSDSYFKLVGEDWVPQIVDDPTLPARVLDGARLVGWHLREVCVARILFESGGRISEVVGLTLGDWHARGLKQEASAFSKGSHGRRIKFLRFSANTAKLLRRYFDGERRTHDSGHRRLHDYVSAADQSAGDLSKVPIFLSSQRTALRANHFRDHFWSPACRAAGIDADVHQARHWYVTMAIRHIHETASTDAEIKRRSRELIAYMKWRRGWETIQAYDHYFDAERHAEVQDELHRRFEQSLASSLQELTRRQRVNGAGRPRSSSGRPVDAAPVDPETAFLERLLR
jgi:integrase